jgi:hypothetical protein
MTTSHQAPALFPEEVAGLVYLDAFHEDWDTYLPERLYLKPQSDPGIVQLWLIRLLSRGRYRRMFASWPPEAREPLIERHLDPAWLRAGGNGAISRSCATSSRPAAPSPTCR